MAELDQFLGKRRYDHLWKEVQDINRYALRVAYVNFTIRGIGFLVVTWTTVVLLGGFVSMLHKPDFWRLMMITLIEILWINVSFTERLTSSRPGSFFLSIWKWRLADKGPRDNPKPGIVGAALFGVALVHNLLMLLCMICLVNLYAYGLHITTSLSIYGLVKKDYHGDTDEGRTNMYLAHNVLYVLCVAQGALLIYRTPLLAWSDWTVYQVSEAYGFQDGSRVVSDYFSHILSGCEKNPSFAGQRNLVTYAIELIESESPSSCLSGTLILDRLLTRQYSDQTQEEREEAIILRRQIVIKHLIGSASSTHILQKLLRALDSRPSYNNKIRHAAARIVEHVAGRINLEQFPRGINCISSLINNFEEYRRLQPHESSSSSPSELDFELEWEVQASEYSESEPESESYNDIHQPSSSEAVHGYKELVLTGLRILWSLAGSEDNCRIISNTNHLVSKIMAPVNYDLVHRSSHSAWSTSVVEASMRVMLRLIMTTKDTEGETGAVLCQQFSNNETTTSMEKFVTCEECKGGELQMMSMQILMELRRCSFTKMLVDFFIKGNCSNVSIRETAGIELVMLFLSSKNVAALLPKEENDEFVCGLAEMVSQAGNKECRISAAEILEHMCIHYSENDEYLLNQKEKYDEYLCKKRETGEHLSTLKNVMARAMPKVLREILLGCTDLESQIPGRPWQNQHHKLYITLLSLYVTACEKLHLDIDAISPGEGDQGERVAFRFAMKMVQSNRDGFSEDSLTVIKLSTRIVIATMMKIRGTNHRFSRSADLESIMDSLTSISETMLVLEGSMVFTAGTMMAVPATADTLNSLVVRAQKLHSEVKNEDSEINVS